MLPNRTYGELRYAPLSEAERTPCGVQRGFGYTRKDNARAEKTTIMPELESLGKRPSALRQTGHSLFRMMTQYACFARRVKRNS